MDAFKARPLCKWTGASQIRHSRYRSCDFRAKMCQNIATLSQDHNSGSRRHSGRIVRNDSAPGQDPRIEASRSYSTAHIPQTSTAENNLYTLTLLTDYGQHTRMTALRTKYFPLHLNKLDAHLTFFHALPESQLAASVIPVIERVAAETSPFVIHATRPFRMKRGFAIALSREKGGRQAQAVRQALQTPWLKQGFLSEQDSRTGWRGHYTIMNKVDGAEVVRKAFEEVEQTWTGDEGVARGLALWRYDRGWWRAEKEWSFNGE